MNRNSFLVVIGLLTCAAPAMAQPAPSLSGVYPPGGALGAKITASIEGANLVGATRALVGGSGVKITMSGSPTANSVPIALEIEPTAAPGPREVRVVTPGGLSSPAYLWVGNLVETPEAEPNDIPSKAQKLSTLPTTIFGRMNRNEDVDWYAFQAQSGDTIVVDIVAQRLFSPVDPTMEIRDTNLKPVAFGMEGNERDPRMIYTCTKAGTYYVEVRDTQYRGGANFIYRLNVGKLRAYTRINPIGAKRGSTWEPNVVGFNLEGVTKLSFPVPANSPVNTPFYVFPEGLRPDALPIALVADDNPQITLTEYGSPSAPVRLPGGPVTVNGVLAKPGESAELGFSATAGQVFIINCSARNLGSRLYPLLKVFDLKGGLLAQTEDQIGRDPTLTFSAPAAGDYRIEVGSADNRGGNDYAFRLSMTPPSNIPDFSISAPDIHTIGKPQATVVNVTVNRTGGFGGDVTIQVAGAPAGVAVSPLTIPAGQNSGFLSFTSDAGTPPATSSLAITGTAMINGKPVTRPCRIFGNLPRSSDGVVVARPVEFQWIGVTTNAPLFTVVPEILDVQLVQGAEVSIKVRAIRKAGDNAANPAIALAFIALPAGVTAELPAIPEKATEITIKLKAAASAAPVLQNLHLTGKIGDNNVASAPVIRLTVKSK